MKNVIFIRDVLIGCSLTSVFIEFHLFAVCFSELISIQFSTIHCIN